MLSTGLMTSGCPIWSRSSPVRLADTMGAMSGRLFEPPQFLARACALRETSKVHRAFVLRAAPVRVSQPPVSTISPFPISTIYRTLPTVLVLNTVQKHNEGRLSWRPLLFKDERNVAYWHLTDVDALANVRFPPKAVVRRLRAQYQHRRAASSSNSALTRRCQPIIPDRNYSNHSSNGARTQSALSARGGCNCKRAR